MSERLSELLREAAPEPRSPVDPDQVWTVARRRNWAARGAGATAATVVIVAGIALTGVGSAPVPSIGGLPPASSETTTPTSPTSPTSEPSSTDRGPVIELMPSQAELRRTYEPMFEGLPRPEGPEPLVSTSSRVEGLGALVPPDVVLPLDQPNAVQDAPAGSTFTITIRDADSGVVIDERRPDTPAGAVFEGPITGAVGTRYVVEGVLVTPEQTVAWTDVAVIARPETDVDIVLTGPQANVPATPGSAPEAFVLVNRGTVGVTYGLGYLIERLENDGTRTTVADPVVSAIGLGLPLGEVAEPIQLSAIREAGRYLLTVTVLPEDMATHDRPARTVTLTRAFAVGASDGQGQTSQGAIRGTLTRTASNFWVLAIEEPDAILVGSREPSLRLDTAAITCAGGSRIGQDELRTGLEARVKFDGVEESQPPILHVLELVVDCPDRTG